MRVQTFSGRTAEAAFERVRRALGDSAVILEVKPQAVGVEVHATGGQSRAGLMRLLTGTGRARTTPVGAAAASRRESRERQEAHGPRAPLERYQPLDRQELLELRELRELRDHLGQRDALIAPGQPARRDSWGSGDSQNSQSSQNSQNSQSPRAFHESERFSGAGAGVSATGYDQAALPLLQHPPVAQSLLIGPVPPLPELTETEPLQLAPVSRYSPQVGDVQTAAVELELDDDEQPSFDRFAASLLALDLPGDLVSQLATVAGDGPGAWQRVRYWLDRTHPVAEPRPYLSTAFTALGLMGASQVGRTTMARGLAARAAIEEPGRIVWLQVGFPARRLEPMGSWEAPLGVDLRRAHHPDELAAIADEHDDLSRLIIDLPSIDPFAEGERRALKRFVDSASAAWPNLLWMAVLPAVWSEREAVRHARALRPLGAEAIGWTFLDRVGDSGTVIASTLRTALAPAFLHGDRRGDGSSSKPAAWEELVERLHAAAPVPEPNL